MDRLLVYILDDCEEDKYIFKSYLDDSDNLLFRVQCFSSIDEIKSAITLVRPDIVITDLNLPNSMGLDTLIKVKNIAPHTPIVVLTGSSEDIGVKAIHLGAQDYLKKGELNSDIVVKTLLFAKERYILQEAIEELAIRDKLTKLYNREAFDKNFAIKVGEYYRYNIPFALIFIDLDKFKPINDEHGHVVGDKVLQLVSERLIRFNRVSDFVARIGGDEFVILASNIKNNEELSSFIQSKRKKLCDTYAVESLSGEVLELNITLSLGGAIMGVDGNTQLELMDLADRVMYQSKRNEEHCYGYDLTDVPKAELAYQGYCFLTL